MTRRDLGKSVMRKAVLMAVVAAVAAGAGALRVGATNARDILLQDMERDGRHLFDEGVSDLTDEELEKKWIPEKPMHLPNQHHHKGAHSTHHHGKRTHKTTSHHEREANDEEANMDDEDVVKQLAQIAAAEQKKKNEIIFEGEQQRMEIQEERDLREEEKQDEMDAMAIPHSMTLRQRRAKNMKETKELLHKQEARKHFELQDATFGLQNEDEDVSQQLAQQEADENPIEYEGDEGEKKKKESGDERKKESGDERKKESDDEDLDMKPDPSISRSLSSTPSPSPPPPMHYLIEDGKFDKYSYMFEDKRGDMNGWEDEPFPQSQISTVRAVLVMEDDREIELGFYEHEAPATVKHILDCFRAGLYESDDFFRIDKGFVAQIADVSRRRLGVPDELQTLANRKVPGEFQFQNFPGKKIKMMGHYLLDHTVGVLSMARFDDPDSGTSSFSIMLGDSPHLNDQYTIFGEVTRGLDVVQSWQDVEVEKKGIFVIPKKRIEIKKTYLLHDEQKRFGRISHQRNHQSNSEPPASESQRHHSASPMGSAGDAHADLEDMSHDDMKELVKHLRGELHKTRQKLLP